MPLLSCSLATTTTHTVDITTLMRVSIHVMCMTSTQLTLNRGKEEEEEGMLVVHFLIYCLTSSGIVYRRNNDRLYVIFILK
jgi:hypothetical protein